MLSLIIRVLTGYILVMFLFRHLFKKPKQAPEQKEKTSPRFKANDKDIEDAKFEDL